MSKSAPAPDYRGAAEEQAQSSREVTEQQTWANRPDQLTPFGNQTWANTPQWDPSTNQYINRWQQTTTLDPELQAALESQQELTRNRSDLGNALFPRAAEEFGQAMDWSKFAPGGGEVSPWYVSPEAMNTQGPQSRQLQTSVSPRQVQSSLDFSGAQSIDPSQRYYDKAGDAVMEQFNRRMEPQFQQDTANLDQTLRNRGIKPGDQIYDQELAKLRTQQGDARQQAMSEATKMAGSEAARMYGMDLGTRQQQVGETTQQGTFGNQAVSQDLQHQLAAGQFGNQAAGQQFAQDLAGLGFENTALGQQFQQNLGAAGSNFNQERGASDQQTQLRQQAIAEEMQRRGFSLNEINALISGQQVAMPSMPNFNTANRAETAQYMTAAQNQYSAAKDAADAKNALTGDLIGGAASMFAI